MNYHDGPVSQERAKELKREWLGLRTEKPKGAGLRWSQMNWLMTQLADSCVKESVRLAETEGDLWERFDKAHDIIHGAWYSVAPSFATDYRKANETDLEAKEVAKINKAKHLLWRRHDVKRAFSDGTGSPEYPAIDKDSLIGAVADYLARPYLRHPFLDWIFLDMSISLEIASYGESLKQNWLPGKRDFMGIHARYIKSQGNLRQMTKIDWNETFERLNNWFWLELGIPIGAIWLSFHFNYMKLGY